MMKRKQHLSKNTDNKNTNKNALGRPLIFITGAPRSGTSLMTKIIDSHPSIAVLMENIFENRRRHWEKADFWHDPDALRKAVEPVYARLNEPIVGNKVVTPDVWDIDDIVQFCRLFDGFKIIYMVRDPRAVALSRSRREPEDFFKVFTREARNHTMLNFRDRFHTYISSWRQSIENYWRLKDGIRENIKLVYYEDLCNDFGGQVRDIFRFLDVEFCSSLLKWYEMPHHDRNGHLVKDLKYPDTQVFTNTKYDGDMPDQLKTAMEGIQWHYGLWKDRRI